MDNESSEIDEIARQLHNMLNPIVRRPFVSLVMDYIRRYYGVPAKRGGRVVYSGGKNGERMGTIKSARGGYLMILLDGDKHPGTFHPTWKLDYVVNEPEPHPHDSYSPRQY